MKTAIKNIEPGTEINLDATTRPLRYSNAIGPFPESGEILGSLTFPKATGWQRVDRIEAYQERGRTHRQSTRRQYLITLEGGGQLTVDFAARFENR